jgi:hypothetical protein
VNYRKERKKESCSLYNTVERILHKHGVDRTCYHGGDFNGVTIRKMMEGADEIMDEVC